MSFPEIDFQPKGPDAIRSRMDEIRARMTAGRRQEFQNQLDRETQRKIEGDGTPAPLVGNISMNGSTGDEKLGPLPPASPMDGGFNISGGPIANLASHPQADKMHVQGLIAQVAREQNIDQSLLKAVVEAESDYNQDEVSKTGAMGLMQLMPDTAKTLGVVDPFNPYENLTGGAKYLSQMMKRYNGNTEMALAAYNAGPTRVDQAKGIPNIPETQNYVNRIMTQLGKR